MERLDDLYFFARVVEAGGFAAAERATGIPKSRLSRRVAALEARLQTQLLHRGARRFVITPTGEEVFRRAQAMIAEAEAAEALVREAAAEPSGLVRVNTSVLFGERVLATLLAEFCDRYPKVTIAMGLTDRFVDVVEERIDLAIRFAGGTLENADVVARRIGTSPVVLVASPTLLRQVPAPASPRDLDPGLCLGMGTPAGVRPWNFRGPDGDEVQVQPKPRFMSDSMVALRQAAIAGLGFAQVPRSAGFREIDDGTLVELLPDWAPAPAIAYAVYPSRRGAGPAVRRLIDFLAERLGPGGETYRAYV